MDKVMKAIVRHEVVSFSIVWCFPNQGTESLVNIPRPFKS